MNEWEKMLFVNCSSSFSVGVWCTRVHRDVDVRDVRDVPASRRKTIADTPRRTTMDAALRSAIAWPVLWPGPARTLIRNRPARTGPARPVL